MPDFCWTLHRGGAQGTVRNRRATRGFLSVSVSALALAALAGPAAAQSVWTGAIDSDWFKAGNWNPAAPPATDVRIDSQNPGAVIDGGPAVVLNGGVSLADTAGSNGSLVIRNSGSLTGTGGSIAGAGGTTAVVTVDGLGSTWTSTGDLGVGVGGAGTLNILSGGVVTNEKGRVGQVGSAAGVVTVDGAGSRWTNNQFLVVGFDAQATLNIRNGGQVESTDGYVGQNTNGVGVVTVDGGTSRWTNSGSLVVGGFGNGTLNILNGARVLNTEGTIGASDGSVGVVTVDGANSRWINSDTLIVARRGQGTLNITNGGAVENMNGAVIGSLADSVGVVRVDGQGSRWVNVGTVGIGSEGSGTLDIVNGGKVFNTHGIIGVSGGSTGVVTVAGQGSSWTNVGVLNVAVMGQGTLNILNGGVVTSTNGVIGLDATAVGAVTVDGAGSRWTNSNDLAVANLGQGALTIRNGGVVENINGFIGLGTSGVGIVTVDGAGSRWTNSGALVLGGLGGSTLNIRNGGGVTNTLAYMGEQAGSTSVATVDGAGSSWFSTDILLVGYRGAGTLDITNGGSVVSAFGALGREASGVGVATIDGAGSVWTTEALYVGAEGTGTLTVRNGGAVTTPMGLFIATVPGSVGTVDIGAAAGDAPAAPGAVNAPTVEFGFGQGTLTFNHTGTGYAFAPSMTGTGTLNQLAGTTILTADSSGFTGPTNVSGGSLIVNGSLANSPVTVTGGLVGGNGTVGHLSVDAGGMVSPGNSVGTLNVAGNVVFSAGSLYGVEIAGTTSDRIAATGTATLNGGTVTVLGATGPYVIGGHYAILTAAGGVNGTFAGVSAPATLPFLTFGLSYDPTNAYLDVGRSAVTFASAGLTPNQIATGFGADSLALTSPLVSALAQLNLPRARAALDRLSGEAHASAKTAMLEDSRFVREAALDRLRAAFGSVGAASAPVMAYGIVGKAAPAPANTERFALWARGFGAWGQWDGDGNAATLRRDVGGAFVGGDASIADWRVGLLGGYSRTTFKVNDRASSGDSDNYHVGLYGGTQWGSLAFRTGVAATWHDISMNRAVAFPGFFENLAAGYDARTTQVFGELGYGLRAGRFGFEPFANLAYVNLSTDGFTERGGVAALRALSGSEDTTYTTLGVRAATDFALQNGAIMTARGTLGWRHAFGDVTPGATFAFAGGSPFTIAGVPIARDAAVVEAGLDWNLTANAALGIAYGGQFGSDATDQSVRANVNVRF